MGPFFHPEAAAQLLHFRCLRRGTFHRGKGPKAHRAAARTRGSPAAVRDNCPAKPLAVASLCARFRIQQRLAAHTPEMHRAELESRRLRRRASCRPMAPRAAKSRWDSPLFTGGKYIFNGLGVLDSLSAPEKSFSGALGVFTLRSRRCLHAGDRHKAPDVRSRIPPG